MTGVRVILLLSFVLALWIGCNTNGQEAVFPSKHYTEFRDSIVAVNHLQDVDTSNLFDNGFFIPSVDSLSGLLVLEDSLLLHSKKQPGLTANDRASILQNLQMLDSFYRQHPPVAGGCMEKECGLYLFVCKPKQMLYLYINQELLDSFPVSTGRKGFETPDINNHPAGPLFTAYTSRKFPGGDYNGLGNMPYAVFVRGGYAIHGTTPGNFSRLGRVASHGCIRLHPDNARIIFELVKLYGLSNTWVRVGAEE